MLSPPFCLARDSRWLWKITYSLYRAAAFTSGVQTYSYDPSDVTLQFLPLGKFADDSLSICRTDSSS
jgi:hypothetical protein